VASAESFQPRRAHLLAHLDEEAQVEAEPPARPQDGGEGREVDGMLALVVGHAPPVPTPVPLGHAPGRQTLAPIRLHAAHHVAVAIAQHRDEARVLDALGEEERPLGRGLLEALAAEA
jgi:hypothetical protein